MKVETPAEGILKRGDFGDSIFYQVVCGCGQEHHDHHLEVEAAETGINVNIYATAKSNYWRETVEKRYDIDNAWHQEFDWFWKDLFNGIVRRIKLTWEVWTTGVVRVETTIAMSEQQALNYSATLKSAINDVKKFRDKHATSVENKQALKEAANQDCV